MKSKRRQRVLMAILAVIAALSVAVWYGWIPNQRHNLRVSNAHVDRMRPILAADPRWKDITLGSYTGGPGAGGCFYVSGSVANEGDAKALARMLIDSKPPVPIYWCVAPSGLVAFRQSVILEAPFDSAKIDAELAQQRHFAEDPGK